MKRVFRVAVGDPTTLLGALSVRLGIDVAAATALLQRGAVELDRRRTTDDVAVSVGARIIAFLPDEDAPATVHTPLVVAYRDAHVIVVDKPTGLRSQEVRGDVTETLISRVQRELDPRATLLHRLDRETSGLVLLPITDDARRQLQHALDAGQIDRHYVARVRGRLEAARTIDLRIGVDPADRRRRVTHPAASTGGEHAITHVEPISASDTESRLRLRLETGRTHQLRVHLAAVGHPILGDTLYGGPPGERLWLHADELVFPDVGGRPRTIRSPGFAT